MLVKDLIELLQKKVREHEADPEYYAMMGELTIHVDRFGKIEGEENKYQYKGYDPNLNIETWPYNGDLIISAFAEESSTNTKS